MQSDRVISVSDRESLRITTDGQLWVILFFTRSEWLEALFSSLSVWYSCQFVLDFEE